MKCYKCGNDIEDNLECPFCGYINKEETRKNIRANDNKINYSNNEKKDEKYENDKVSNKVINVFCKILCYMQVAFSVMMALVCFALEKPFVPFISWSIVALAFIPKIKQIIISKIPKFKKWMIPIRIIFIILTMVIFIANLSQIYEDEWVSNNGMSVKLKDNIAVVVEDGVEYNGNYKTQYIDGVTNINITTESKNFKFYFTYNNDIIEFYYMKDNEKIYLVPKVKKSTYTYIEGENK
ncbi:MAG: hypothetical protein ILA02_03125 [Clostridia bacterium]|nr:hypothetical protein [Clostridia bacterium]